VIHTLNTVDVSKCHKFRQKCREAPDENNFQISKLFRERGFTLDIRELNGNGATLETPPEMALAQLAQQTGVSAS
jgi:hypothetical protein